MEEAYNCLEMGDDNEEDYAIQTDGKLVDIK